MNNAEAASAPSIKRRKTSPTGVIHTITDLPNEQLVAIAEYLSQPSLALFAVALTAPSKSWRATGWKGDPSKATTAVISSANENQGRRQRENPWEVLDFWEIRDERGLGEKLTDDDIGAVLACINAKENLKTICFSNCPNLVGHGLEPLRGSVVLEKVVLKYMYTVEHESLISERAVIPILDSILDAEGNSLRTMNLPGDWIKKSRNETPLREFFAKFNRLMLEKEMNCQNCDKLCRGDGGSLSCLKCFSVRICAECKDEENEELHLYDRGRIFVGPCDCCGENVCTMCGRHSVCGRCNSVYCSSCQKGDADFGDLGIFCDSDYCGREPLCLGCRVHEDQADCSSCMDLVYPEIMEENRRLTQENKELREKLDSGGAISSLKQYLTSLI